MIRVAHSCSFAPPHARLLPRVCTRPRRRPTPASHRAARRRWRACSNKPEARQRYHRSRPDTLTVAMLGDITLAAAFSTARSSACQVTCRLHGRARHDVLPGLAATARVGRWEVAGSALREAGPAARPCWGRPAHPAGPAAPGTQTPGRPGCARRPARCARPAAPGAPGAPAAPGLG